MHISRESKSIAAANFRFCVYAFHPHSRFSWYFMRSPFKPGSLWANASSVNHTDDDPGGSGGGDENDDVSCMIKSQIHKEQTAERPCTRH